MQTPAGHFRTMLSALERGCELPPETARWLHDAAVTVCVEKTSFDAALGLRGRGLEQPAAVYARQSRDESLAAAFALVQGKSVWQRCVKLSQAIKAFECRTWPRIQNDVDPPARLTAIQVHLFQAFKACAKVPSSASHLSSFLL